MPPIDWLSLSPEELTELMREMGLPSFRGKQIFEWLHIKRVKSFAEMTNLPATLKTALDAEHALLKSQIVVEQNDIAGRSQTAKYLVRLSDGEHIETVLMKYSYGYSLCISSQVGCRMGCKFCASTLNGMKRNLTPGEMLEQIYLVEEAAAVNVSHVVIMGCGEPLDNYDNLIRFLRLVNNEKGKNLSLRNITVSTCGLVPKMKMLAGEGLPITLAISLHAPNQGIRSEIMNVARAYSYEDVLEAAGFYARTTGRRVTFEYALIKDVNDSAANAEELAGHIKGMLAHVNLIPLNPVKECGFDRPSKERVEAFKGVLEEKGIPVSVRREMGTEIDAACGQLRAKREER